MIKQQIRDSAIMAGAGVKDAPEFIKYDKESYELGLMWNKSSETIADRVKEIKQYAAILKEAKELEG